MFRIHETRKYTSEEKYCYILYNFSWYVTFSSSQDDGTIDGKKIIVFLIFYMYTPFL